jgi:hypothetical protein
MTVGELRDELAKYPSTMPVWATWEGVLAYVGRKNFAVKREKNDIGHDVDCLVIDVEDYVVQKY